MSESFPHNIEELLNLISNANGEPAESLRERRIQAISKLGDRLPTLTDPRGFMCLLDLIRQEEDPILVTHAVSVLSRANMVGSVMTLVDVAMGHDIALYEGEAGKAFRESDESVKLRTAAVRALGRLKDNRAIIPLMSILNDRNENYRLRLATAESLGRIGDEHAVRPLLDIVVDEREKSAYLKESAVKALGMLGDIRAMEALIDEMESKKGFWNKFQFLKEHLFEAIGRLGSPSQKISKTLLNALEDEAPSIRLAAVEALGSLGDPESLPVLQKMLFDVSDEVALAAVEAIYSIGGEEALRELLHLDNLPKILREAVYDYFMADEDADGEEEDA